MDRLYPLAAGLLHHRLPDHPRLSRAALAGLGERLPAAQVEYNPRDLPVGIRPEDIPANGLSIVETIRAVDTNRRCPVRQPTQSDPDYRQPLIGLHDELTPAFEPPTAHTLPPQHCVFTSSAS